MQRPVISTANSWINRFLPVPREIYWENSSDNENVEFVSIERDAPAEVECEKMWKEPTLPYTLPPISIAINRMVSPTEFTVVMCHFFQFVFVSFVGVVFRLDTAHRPDQIAEIADAFYLIIRFFQTEMQSNKMKTLTMPCSLSARPFCCACVCRLCLFIRLDFIDAVL